MTSSAIAFSDLFSLFAQAPAGGAAGGGGLLGNPMVFLVLVVVVMFFILIRSQRNKVKQADTPVPSDFVGMLVRRYTDSYTEAHALVVIGKIIKIVGAVLAVIILLGGFQLASSGGGNYARSDVNGNVAGIGFALACLVGIPIYVLGILVAAQGQLQLATLDTSVNSSRHLKDDDVAQILSKRFGL